MPASELIFGLGFIAAVMFLFATGAFVADYIMPHIPFLERWLDTLPDFDDEYDAGEACGF